MPPPSSTLGSTLKTSLSLLDQFRASLSSVQHIHPSTSSASISTFLPYPLPLLYTSAANLKSQTTKVSLLAITSPFTPSAVAGCLVQVNEIVLPSLVCAALQTTPAEHTASFSLEINTLLCGTLRELKALVGCIEKRSRDQGEISQCEKDEFTESTGRVWDGCDELVRLAEGGVIGFLVRRAGQWLELMKDAVRELEGWNPEDEVDNIFEDGEDDSQHEDGERIDADCATIQSGVKSEALKVLRRIPQSVHVVLKQRLEKVPRAEWLGKVTRDGMEVVVSRAKTISECIDESVEAIYTGDLEGSLKKAGEARQVTIEVLESVVQPWDTVAGSEETKEDKYVKRALEWIRQVEPGGASEKLINGSHERDR